MKRCQKQSGANFDYLERNRQRMDYGRFRLQGLFIGSGVVEAGSKRIIGQRLKQSGMFWCESGATAMATLRAALLSAQTWIHYGTGSWRLTL